MPLMKPENEDSLKLEIWREIMRTKDDYYPGMMGGGGGVRPAPNPVASATRALETFNTLYAPSFTVTTTPAPRKAAKRKARR